MKQKEPLKNAKRKPERASLGSIFAPTLVVFYRVLPR